MSSSANDKKKSKSPQRSILVTGDVIVDHHIYQGSRLETSSVERRGTSVVTEVGGAQIIYDILKNQPENSKSIQSDLFFDPIVPDVEDFPSQLHAYALWKYYPDKKNSGSPAWRVEKLLGYGEQTAANIPVTAHAAHKRKSDIVVIDDAALGFRSNDQLWKHLFTQDRISRTKWFVVKMSDPVTQDLLWSQLQNLGRVSDKKNSGTRDKLILVLSARDLRRQQVMISQGRSWEQAVIDVLTELDVNPIFYEVQKCAHLIIKFDLDGALLISNPGGKQQRSILFFDPGHLEGEWKSNYQGSMLGLHACFTAGIVHHLDLDSADSFESLESGIVAGLSAMRQLFIHGHGTSQNLAKKGFPHAVVARSLADASLHASFSRIEVSKSCLAAKSKWSILQGSRSPERSHPLYGVARRVAVYGQRAITGMPYGQFGFLLTADRSEIESLKAIEKLIHEYAGDHNPERPLSLAVFGPPGSGKSFGIKQIAKAVNKNPGKENILEFNLSQFDITRPEELIGAFHLIRDKVLQGIVPFVFWDEFDSQGLAWLQYLLAPMQDGYFMENQVNHPLGKCVFIFAGGTSYTFEGFVPPARANSALQNFKVKKGPDFVSRLRGYLNVLGPNRRQTFNPDSGDCGEYSVDENDQCFPLRRAMLIRGMLKLKGSEKLDIDDGLLSALLKVDTYKHGARSLETIISLTRAGQSKNMSRSHLPPPEQLGLHTDYNTFMSFVDQDSGFQRNAVSLAPYIHEYYRESGRQERWLDPELDKDFLELSPSIQEDNRAAAKRIPAVLAYVGLQVVPIDHQAKEIPRKELDNVLEENKETLGEIEHDRWMAFKISKGWCLWTRKG